MRQPSLRRRLLLFLLVPMLALLLIDAVVTYDVALNYANRVHDNDMADDALTLATMLKTQAPHGKISSQARFLLEFDPDGRDYFSVRSSHHGFVDGNRRLLPISRRVLPGRKPQLYNRHLGRTALRVASMAIANPRDHHDILQVTVAETLTGRHQVARQILLLSIPLELGLTVALLLLVWLGVRFGLRVIDPLTERLAHREHDLSPIDDGDMPKELLPLTGTIDALFARLRDMIAVQDRFISDAAHQLRTPLSGLRLQVERALQHAREPRTVAALRHVENLTKRVSRTSTQLLALTRAQMRPTDTTHMLSVDLAELLPQHVGSRVAEAIAAGVDLGLEVTPGPVWVRGDSDALREALDNLVDNAMRYAGHGGMVTVSLVTEAQHMVCLQVDDDGPGVTAASLARLGERFFRAPDSGGDGTGLGLAIVQRIVLTHGGTLTFTHAALGGLSAQIRLPPHDVAAADSGTQSGSSTP